MFEFNNVSFSYKDVKEQALVDLNFSIKKGSLTLITGSSGSGKSTLLKLMNGLIPRLYDATEGEVYVGGVNVKDYHIET